MSDPVTNVEIEDVLSSIRKLVSADDRPAKDDENKAEPMADRLVLTPSLRVDQMDDADPTDDTEMQPDDTKAQPDHTKTQLDNTEAQPSNTEAQARDTEAEARDTEVQSVTAEPESKTDIDDVFETEAPVEDASAPEYQAAVIPKDDAADHFEPDDRDAAQDEELLQAADQEALADAPDIEDAVSGGVDQADAAEEDNLEEAPEATARHGRAAIFQRVAAATDDQWEPDGPTEDANAKALETPIDVQQPDHLAAEEPVAPVETSDDAGPTPFEAEAMEGLEAFSSEQDMPEEAELYADPAMDRSAGSSPPDPPDEADPGNAFLAEEDMLDDADAVLDEEMLRDLVAEIVRQELQGSLGERITRNVRKLVRREIQRALAAQELE